LRAARRRRGVTQEVLAGLCGVTPAYLSMIENGKRQLESYSLIMNLASALGVPAGEIAPGMPASAAAARPGHAPGQRRVVRALEVIGDENAGNAADSLADLVDYYSHAIGSASPAVVYDELLAVRSRARQVIMRADLQPRRSDLLVSAGWLSNLLAVAACDLGEHATARVWCADSVRRSKDTGCPELAAWALLTRALIAYYQGRSRQSAALAAQGRALAAPGTAVYAKLAAQEMRAAAQAGDLAGMSRARRDAAAAIRQLRPAAMAGGVFSVAVGEDPPYTATSLLLLGDFREAVPATNRVITTVYRAESRNDGENPSGYARSLLILGLAHAGGRCLDQAVAAGDRALAGQRPAWPTMVLAGHLDTVLAREYPGASQAAAYHARYLEALSQHANRPDRPPGNPH
jgi:transcriptional regulator with XRE-family HTH domain